MAAFAMPLFLGATSLLGGILGNRKQTQKQMSWGNTQNNTNYSNFTDSNATNYNRTDYDPALMGLRNQLINAGTGSLEARGKWGDPNQLAQSTVNQNIFGLNKQADVQNKLFQQGLSSRGMGNSIAGLYGANVNDASRIQGIIQAQNQQPQLARQFMFENQNQDNAMTQLANQIFGNIPKDTTQEQWSHGQQIGSSETTGSNSQATEGTVPSNMMGGGLSSLSSMLAYLMGQGLIPGLSNYGKVGTSSSGGGGWGGIHG